MHACLSLSLLSFCCIRNCIIWTNYGGLVSCDGTRRLGGFTQRQSGGSTWQSSRHVTDGRQARASAGREGGGGVDWGGRHGTQVGRVRLFIRPGRRGLGLTRVWWGETERGKERRRGNRQEKKERIVTKGPASGSNVLFFYFYFFSANISSKLTITFTTTLDIISISVSWCLCLEVSISWAHYATSSIMTHLMFTLVEKIFLFAL